MIQPTIIDTGPIVSYLHNREVFHKWADESFKQIPRPMITCEPVITEALYLVRALSDGASRIFELFSTNTLILDFDLSSELDAVEKLMNRYSNIPMSLADACLVRMSELHKGSRILTLDSDFQIYRRNGRQIIPTIMPP